MEREQGVFKSSLRATLVMMMLRISMKIAVEPCQILIAIMS